MRAVLRLFIIVLSTIVLAACGGDDPPVVSNNDDANNDGTNNSANNTNSNQDSCPSGEEVCGDAGCVDTSSDIEHCGACDTPCEGGPNTEAECGESQCDVTCVAGFIDSDGDLEDATGNGCEQECTPTNGGVEICDGVDNDCNGEVDENFVELDAACTVGTGACEATGNYVCNAAGDDVECDVQPGTPADETCGDMVDNDCDGSVDEDDAVDASTWYLDADGDDYGVDTDTTTACEQPMGYAPDSGDCDDADTAIYPMAPELCDAIDNDCDMDIDEDYTNLGDACSAGVGVCEESGTYVCNAAMDATECNAVAGTPMVMTEATCDGLDENCDGMVDEGCDDDMDGWCDDSFTVENTTTECAGGTQTGDCNDTDADIHPATIVAGCDGIDNDCNGQIDEIQPVGDTSVADFTFTGIDDTNTNGFPPAVLSAPSPNGFCIAAYDSDDTDLLIAHVASDGTSDEITISKPPGSDRDLLDVQWGIGRCGVLYRYSGGLQLITWAPGDTSATFDSNVDDGTYGDQVGSARQNAALYLTAQGSGQIQPFVWVIAYTSSGGLYGMYYRTLLVSATSGTQLSAEEFVAGGSSIPDIDVGPAPDAADDFMIVRAGSDGLLVNSVDGSGTPSDQPDLERTDKTYRHPAINVANGDVYIIADAVADDQWNIMHVTDQYEYGLGFGAQSYQNPATREYYSSHMLAENPDDPSLLWFMDPINERTFQMEYQFLIGYAFTEYDHPADVPTCTNPPCLLFHNELLAIDTRGEFIEVLTKFPFRTSPNFHINQFSCY